MVESSTISQVAPWTRDSLSACLPKCSRPLTPCTMSCCATSSPSLPSPTTANLSPLPIICPQHRSVKFQTLFKEGMRPSKAQLSQHQGYSIISYLLLYNAAGCSKWLCKAGLLVCQCVWNDVQIGRWKRQIFCHCALSQQNPELYHRILSANPAFASMLAGCN